MWTKIWRQATTTEDQFGVFKTFVEEGTRRLGEFLVRQQFVVMLNGFWKHGPLGYHFCAFVAKTLGFSIELISLASAARNCVRILSSKSIFARLMRRCRFEPRKNSS